MAMRGKVEVKNEEQTNLNTRVVVGALHNNQTVAAKVEAIRQEKTVARINVRHTDELKPIKGVVGEEGHLITSRATKSHLSRSPTTIKLNSTAIRNNTKNTQISNTTTKCRTLITLPNRPITSTSRPINSNNNTTLAMAKSSTTDMNRIMAQNIMSQSNNTLKNPELPQSPNQQVMSLSKNIGKKIQSRNIGKKSQKSRKKPEKLSIAVKPSQSFIQTNPGKSLDSKSSQKIKKLKIRNSGKLSRSKKRKRLRKVLLIRMKCLPKKVIPKCHLRLLTQGSPC